MSTFPVRIFICNRCGRLIPKIIRERLRAATVQSPRTRPGHSATRGYSPAPRPHSPRSTQHHSGSHSFSGHPQAGSFRERAPGRSDLRYSVGCDRPLPGTRGCEIRRGGPAYGPAPDASPAPGKRCWLPRALLRAFRLLWMLRCFPAALAQVLVLLLSAPPGLCVYVYANAPLF